MLKREDGFTLVEMLIAMVIALIVSLAAFSLIEVVMRRTGEIGARVETTQRARTAMDDLTRELRSEVCVIRSDPSLMTSARTIFSAKANEVVFFADTADESIKNDIDPKPVPTLRTLTFTSGASATGTISETIRPGIKDTSHPGIDAVSFLSATGEKTRTVLTNIEQVKAADNVTDVPVFRYFTYDVTVTPPTLTKELLPGAGSLTTAQVASIAKISIAYKVRAVGKVTQRVSTTLQSDVFVRTVDPNITTPKPICL
jgi:prepilin-type N-terminal cleavage/methylation domain-containing protein